MFAFIPLGLSYHTTGYWKHALWSISGLWTTPALNFLMCKDLMRKKQEKEKEKSPKKEKSA